MSFNGLHGLSNDFLRKWIEIIGSNLEHLSLICSAATRAQSEQHTIDATIALMANLSMLHLHGDVATELDIVGKQSSAPNAISSKTIKLFVKITSPAASNVHGVVAAMKLTA